MPVDPDGVSIQLIAPTKRDALVDAFSTPNVLNVSIQLIAPTKRDAIETPCSLAILNAFPFN
jgi:hypothetical protein